MFSFDLGYDVSVGVNVSFGPPVAIRVPDGGDHHKSGLGLYLPILVFAGAGALFLLLSIWFLCCYCLKARLRLSGINNRVEVGENLINGEPVQLVEDHQEDIDHPIWYIRTQGLQQTVIDSISIVKFRKNEKLVEGSDCSICLSEFEEDESLRLLPKCSHAFHVPCIDQWFKSHKNCPLCRSPVTDDIMGAAPVEEVRENQIGLEGQESNETVIVDVNTSQEDSDLDSSTSQNELNRLVANKDSSVSGSSKSKHESDSAESIDVDQIPQLMRRSVSAGPVSTSNLHNAVADIKIDIDSDSPVQQIKATRPKSSMKRSVSYGGKPSSGKSIRSQKSILPY